MMTWSELLHRLVLVQGTTRLCAVRDLDELDIVGRIMRKENYLIGMLNAGVLGLYVKGLGPFGGRRFMLTKTLEWNLYLCILDPMFDEHFHIKQVRLLWPTWTRTWFPTMGRSPGWRLVLAAVFDLCILARFPAGASGSIVSICIDHHGACHAFAHDGRDSPIC